MYVLKQIFCILDVAKIFLKVKLLKKSLKIIEGQKFSIK